MENLTYTTETKLFCINKFYILNVCGTVKESLKYNKKKEENLKQIIQRHAVLFYVILGNSTPRNM